MSKAFFFLLKMQSEMFKNVTATKIKELKKKKRFQQKMRASDEKTLSTINRQGALYTLRAFTFLVRLASILT